ncbi:MAG: hypothetical protein ABSA11_17010 [Candidatus Bathyarchaeia archaeon]
MVDLVEIQTIYYMVAATGVLVAAAYYVLNMRATRRTQELALKSQDQTLQTRQAQLFMGVYQTSISRDFLHIVNKLDVEVKNWDDFDRILKDPETYEDFTGVVLFFEGIGVLVRENLIDVRLVSLLISGLVTGWWEKYGPYILQARERLGFPRWCIEFEYLNDRIIEFGRENPGLRIVPERASSRAWESL